MYSSIEAAAEIGTTPRLLRRYLRSNDSYRNAGIGGRYMFTEAEVKTLKKDFHAWHGTKPAPSSTKVDPFDYLDQDPGISVEEMLQLPRNPKLKADVLRRRSERMHRLDARIKEVGLHTVPTFFDEEVDA